MSLPRSVFYVVLALHHCFLRVALPPPQEEKEVGTATRRLFTFCPLSNIPQVANTQAGTHRSSRIIVANSGDGRNIMAFYDLSYFYSILLVVCF